MKHESEMQKAKFISLQQQKYIPFHRLKELQLPTKC